MILLLFFLPLQVNIDLAADVNMRYAYPTSDLFFAHPGFANPALSEGLIGFMLNPAALARVGGMEAMICLAPNMKTVINTEFVIPLDSVETILDSITVPTDLGIEQTGGIDFAGLMLSFKGWHLAVGGQRGDCMELDCHASVRPSAGYEMDYQDTLTHDLLPDLGLNDSIPVRFVLSATGDLMLNADGNGKYITNSMNASISRKLLGIDMGVGLQITPVTIDGGFASALSGALGSGVALDVEPYNDWTIDASFDVEVDADSVLRCNGSAGLSFCMTSLTWGLKKDWRYLSIGLCGEASRPTLINGDWDLYTSLPTEIPRVRFDDDSLVIDTVNKVISGHATMVIYDFETEDTTRYGLGEIPFLGTAGATAGLEARIWRFQLGFFGGLSSSEDGTYTRIRTGLNLGFRAFIPLRFGLIAHFQYFNVAGIPMSALPVIAFGGGTDFHIMRNLSLFINVSGNTTQGAAALVIPGIVGGEASTSALVSLGLGLRYRFNTAVAHSR